MNIPPWIASAVFVILLKWTCLLALGWLANSVLRHRHARWRLILWRSILCFGLALPLLELFHVPVVRIPIPVHQEGLAGFESPLLAGGALNPAPGAAGPGAIHEDAVRTHFPLSKPIPWALILGMGWILGCGVRIGRLVRLSVQLSRLTDQSAAAAPDIQRLASQIQRSMNIPRTTEVRVSDSATSPFVCGTLKPAIILPRRLAEQLPQEELTALLSHEIAHVCRHDVAWCVAWQWMRAACWFHPLARGVPGAHNLACDQEADRIASGQLEDEDAYAQMLARLALRVLALPPVETTFALNGSSRIAQRLNLLSANGMGRWDWKHSAAAFGLAGILFLIAAGSGFSEAPAVLESGAQPAGTPAANPGYPQKYGVYVFDGKTYTEITPGDAPGDRSTFPINASVLVFDKSLADPRASTDYLKIFDWMHLGEKPAGTVPVLKQPVENHPGMIMLIPKQPLKPGLYSVDVTCQVPDCGFGVETPDIALFWNSVLQINPQSWQAHNHLGAILYMRGDIKGAYPHFRKATQLNPANPESHNNLALALSSFGKMDEAIREYETAVKLKDDTSMDTNLANAYSAVKRYDDAVKTYRHAIELDPNNVSAHCNLGYVLMQQGKLDDAISEFKEAIKLDPKMPYPRTDLQQALSQKAGKS